MALPAAERPLRLAEFDDLFAVRVRSAERSRPLRLRLTLAPEGAAVAADLMVRESACCSFFTFRLTAAGGLVQLDVEVPRQHRAILDAIETRALTALSAGLPG